MQEKSIDIILEKLPDHLRQPLSLCRSAYENKANELVIRADKPLCLYTCERTLFVTDRGFLTDVPRSEGLLCATHKDIADILLKLCDYSVYTYQNEINSGFITVKGGVRVGLCGRAVIKDSKISCVRDVTTLSFRVARDVFGCANLLLSKLNPLKGVLVCGEPCSGKTTIIRDMARFLSYRYRISVLDERCELSACSTGEFGYDLGLCDVFAGYPKGTAAVSAVRSMSPDIIVCDELGDKADVDLLMYSLRSGASFIASVHASSMQDLREREVTKNLINTGAFRYIAFLSGRHEVGRVEKIYEFSDVCA